MDRKSGSTLKMHTTMIPENTTESKIPLSEKAKRRAVKLRRASFSERLMRNTAVACALLLSVMALKNMNTPFTDRLTDKIKSVVSMNFEIDNAVGELSFVQKLMPESALVFLNMTPANKTPLPVSGTIFHAYSPEQPWTEFKTADDESIRSIKAGTVEACVKTVSSDWTILVSHTDGSKAVYAYVEEPFVSSGDTLEEEALLGRSGKNEHARLYLEYRVNGQPTDPGNLLKGYEE